MNSLIKNVAIIMDGNGRWATSRSRARVWGHIKGSNNVREIVNEACKLNLNSLTLYAFSTENWSRPTTEITSLFKLLKKFLVREKRNILKENIKFKVIGNYKVLEDEIVNLIDDLTESSSQNTGLCLNIAINYGGRSEILDAVNLFIKNNPGTELREEDISNNLYEPEISELDLLIRTAGDHRVSNFLLWEMSYSEIYFTDTKWPEFTKEEFSEIIKNVSGNIRKFGGLIKEETNDSIIRS